MKSPIGAAPLFMSMVVAAWTAVAGQQRRAGPPQAHESSARASVQYRSPDESAVALVFPAGKPGHESHESRVEVRSKSGRLLAQHEYSSGDGSTATESQRQPGPRTPVSLCTAWKTLAASSPGIPRWSSTAGPQAGFSALTMRSMTQSPMRSSRWRHLTG